MLDAYRWLKGRCCDNVATTNLFLMQLKSPGMAEIPSANEKLTAFLELESAIRACGELS